MSLTKDYENLDEKNNKIKFITLSYLDEKCNAFYIEIPFTSVFNLEIECITHSVIINSKVYVETLNCKVLDLSLYEDKINRDILDILKEKSFVSIKISFYKGDIEYMLPVSYKNIDGKTKNILQQIKIYDGDGMNGVLVNLSVSEKNGLVSSKSEGRSLI